MKNLVILFTLYTVCIVLLTGGVNAQACRKEKEAATNKPEYFGQYIP